MLMHQGALRNSKVCSLFFLKSSLVNIFLIMEERLFVDHLGKVKMVYLLLKLHKYGTDHILQISGFQS